MYMFIEQIMELLLGCFSQVFCVGHRLAYHKCCAPDSAALTCLQEAACAWMCSLSVAVCCSAAVCLGTSRCKHTPR